MNIAIFTVVWNGHYSVIVAHRYWQK